MGTIWPGKNAFSGMVARGGDCGYFASSLRAEDLQEPSGRGMRVDAPVINIAGERVALGPMRRDRVPVYGRWLNDFQIYRTYGGIPPRTDEQVIEWYERRANAADAAWFTVYLRDDWTPIGIAGLYEIRLQHPANAIYEILIGERDQQGKGLGTEATRLILDYAFTALRLHNFMLRVDAHNRAGIRAYEKAGFREFGRRREVLAAGGRLWDVVYMDILATEFDSPVLGTVLTPEQREP